MNLVPLRRYFFEPLQLKIAGSPRISYWKTLEKTQWCTKSQLEEIQWRRLQELWHFLWENNKFYIAQFQKAGLNKESLSEPGDIRKLPLLSKKDIRDNVNDLISLGYDKNNLLHFKTGGSTGKALDIFVTEECSELRNACARRHDRWTGWELGEAIGAAWGNPKQPKTIKEKLINSFVQPYVYLDTMAVTEHSVHRFVADWKRVRPTMLFGHAHSLFVLAQKIDNMGIKGIEPVGILSTSMMLIPHERKVIEKVFGVKVTDRYGCEEVSLIGSECEQHDGLHMNIEHLVVEFVKDDGSYAGPGEPGSIVVTDLMNRAMPFVRYRVEDIGIPLDRQCSCGRGLPLMGKVTGRVADFLVKQDGTKVAGISLIENTLTYMPGLDQLQIVQERLDNFILNVVPGKDYTTDVGNSLVVYFKDVFGKDVQVKLQLVAEIQPEKSGKYRFSICRISK
ncbi:MAG: phenylacetate--CoA ligase family protein [Desulfuromonadales bacterium]|nr:phenylacetate--CoA ligase family protein [Desulfuromonadales bacterium]